MKKSALFALAALAPLALATHSYAQDTAADAPTTVQELIVTGEIVYRDRTEATAPTLSYDQGYFQRFEPVSAGDALKRVPSVTFLSDVLESDGARLRGLDPGYTQILINGERVPGASADRSFFVDRIPAELLERIEIIRAPSANRSGDAMAGSLNIVLRDSASLDGGYVRAGVTYYDDEEFAENYGFYWGGAVGEGRLLIGANVQGRRAPKLKTSFRYDEPGGTLENIEDQTDVRDGTDYSFNANYVTPFAGGELTLDGYFVRTDRVQDEDSLEYKSGIRNDANLLTINDNDLDILTDSWSARAKFVVDMLGGESKFKLGYSAVTDEQFEFEKELEFLRSPDVTPFPDADRFTHEEITSELEDSEFTAEFEHERDLGGAKLTFGLQYNDKQRDALVIEERSRFNIANGVNSGATFPAPGAFTLQSFGDVSIEETRLDPFAMLSGKNDGIRWEVGLRYETTETTIVDDSGIAVQVTKNDYTVLLPSANLRINVGDGGRINLSAGRTVRRPNFDKLLPILLVGEYGDDDFIGNANLEPETAWGFDIGYERRLGARGVVGVNFFYRDVSDLIEDVNLGEVDPVGNPGVNLYTVDNVGDGSVMGVEFDLSTPLTMFGLDNTGVFLNYSWLDSEVEDFAGKRLFNGQSDYVYNVGFIQDIPSWAAAFGVTYRKQGDANDRVALEEVSTSYGADLEAFIEKRFGESLVIRLTGQNLLDGSKDEVFDKFDNFTDQAARDYDEYELETEKAGPVFQLTARYAF